MMQPSTPLLFDQPLSHRNDPLTSYLAAEKLAKSGKWTTQKKEVYETLKQHNGSTSAELGIFCNLNRYQVARRLPELEKKYHLVEKGDKRQCHVTNRHPPCVTWWLAGTKPKERT